MSLARHSMSRPTTASTNMILVTAPRSCELSDGIVRIEPCQTTELPFLSDSSTAAATSPIRNSATISTAETKETATTRKPWLVLSSWTESNFGADREDDSPHHRNDHPQHHYRAGYNHTKQQPNVIWQELHPTTTAAAAAASAVVRLEESSSFDASREYGYKYEFADAMTNEAQQEEEEVDDDDDDNHDDEDQRTSKTIQVTTTTRLSSSRNGSKVTTTTASSIPPLIYYYVLGKLYHPTYHAEERREDESSLFWFTYRCDFYEIVPYRITTDAGWGCMLRSAQMLLGQALRMHYQGRDWKPPVDLAQRRTDAFVQDILTWFADFPSTTMCRFSLHNMVAAGMAKYEILPGEWYGPSTACYVLRDLVQLFEQQQQASSSSTSSSTKSQSQQSTRRTRMFRVHVAAQGTVYRDEIHNIMTTQQQQRSAKTKKQQDAKPIDKTASLESSSAFFHPLDPGYNHESPAPEKVNYDVEWDTSLLLLIPLRLGLKSFQSDYVQSLAFSFSLPQSVGVLGGRPRGARWFYGATSDGSRVLGLDPHTIQSAPQLVRQSAPPSSDHPSGQRQPLQVELTDEYLQSIHTCFPEVFSLYKMDPSIALGFYCQNNAALEHLIQAFGQWKMDHANLPDLFTVADTTPDYLAAASSMSSQLSDNTGLSVTSLDRQVQSISLLDDMVGDDDGEENDDDVDSHASDEYVML